MKNIKINIQIIYSVNNIFPKKSDFFKWIKNICLKKKLKKIEINIKIVNSKEMSYLNMKFCKKNYPTNILSFSVDDIHKKNSYFIGDLIICKEIIELEAIKYKKKIKEHWAHIVIHGTLHLLNYNHNNKKKAIKMEYMENKFLKKLGYSNPYL
ncbi:rRNA maturation RNase YbeY [Sodalis-like secondary symbiont of Drepanosiphum platanoidis]|uniref:rRNA maturation RNase YbeY n=1 Tax=Sodalis-like secondary symbiont of Drepanosiphum platanoidis TaxID=2994493 RepID=UPI0034647CBE